MKLRIATYNIHRAVGGDGRADPSRIARTLEELDADLVALQEVSFGAQLPGELLERLAGSMDAEVIAGATLHDARGHYGNAVLSRLPVERASRFDLSVRGREPRGAIEISTGANGVSLQVVATHLGLRPAERRHQIAQLLPLFDASTADVKMLLGDLNEWFLWGRPIRWLHRVFDPGPAPATFPAHRPWLALDRLWVTPSRVLERLYVHDSESARAASDHLPLVGELHV